MIGQYVNTGRGRRVTISPAVPGAQYRITAWALSDSRRSATPAKYPITEAGECDILTHTFTREVSVWLSWLLHYENWAKYQPNYSTSCNWTMSLSNN